MDRVVRGKDLVGRKKKRREGWEGRMGRKDRVSGSPVESVCEVGFWVGLYYTIEMNRRPYGVWGMS